MACQRKTVAGFRGFRIRFLIVVQFEGVHLRPILKVLRGIMKMMRLVIQNRTPLSPAGPRGKTVQKKEEMLAGQRVSGDMFTGSSNIPYQSPETAETERCHSRATAAARSQRVCHIEVRYLLYDAALGATGRVGGILMAVDMTSFIDSYCR